MSRWFRTPVRRSGLGAPVSNQRKTEGYYFQSIKDNHKILRSIPGSVGWPAANSFFGIQDHTEGLAEKKSGE